MSIAPCDAHGDVVNGRLCGIYPCLVRDGQRLTGKRKLCRDCLNDLLLRHKQDWSDSVFTQYSAKQNCCHSCGSVTENLSTLRRFYITVYVDSKTRRDYSAYYCDECSDLIREELVLHV